jgi:hypothetical protein
MISLHTHDIATTRDIDVQTFSADGTWTRPARATAASMTLIEVIGAGGGGGGGGRRDAAGAATASGGAGGGGGGYVTLLAHTLRLPSTVPVYVGAGGAGGAGAADAEGPGAFGEDGGNSTFGLDFDDGPILKAWGGEGGGEGSADVVSVGGGGGGVLG